MRKKGFSESEIGFLEAKRDESRDEAVTHDAKTVTPRDGERKASRKNRNATVTQRDADTHAVEKTYTIINTSIQIPLSPAKA